MIQNLIIIGEWMAPIILKNTGRRLAEYKSNLSDYTGFLECGKLCRHK
jgi:hypothetical protein